VPVSPPQIPHDCDISVNPDRRGGKPATKRLSYGTVMGLSRVWGTRYANKGFWFGWLDILAPWLQVLLIAHKYSAIADLHNFQFTITHALRLSVFTSRLLATYLNTEISTSAHYEAFLLLHFQSLWKLGNIRVNSSELTPPAYDWLVTALERTLSLHSFLLQELCTDSTENTVSLVADVTAYAEMCSSSRCLETGCITPLFHRSSARTT
jgi:hypothetical protein